MKKLIALVLAVMSLCLIFAGCQTETPNDTTPPAPTDAIDAILDTAFGLAEGASMDSAVTLTGKITKISEGYSEQYENVSVVISVKGRELLCYHLKGTGADTLAVDDTITVTGTIKNYYGTIEFVDCTFVLVEKGGNSAPSIPDGYVASLSFADKTNRTEQTTEVQIWAQNGITVTNNKAESTSNVADYANPARFYKSSSLKIEYAGMKKIVFELNLSDPKHAAAGISEANLPADATCTVNGYVVTIELSSAANSIEITGLANQIRVKAIYIYK